MAISYLRSPDAAGRLAQRRHRKLTAGPRRLRPWHYGAAAVLLALVAVAIVALIVSSSSASLTADSSALAKIWMPLGGGKIESVTVTGPHGKNIPVTVSGDPQIWPRKQIPAHERVSITVVVKRPGWISWLSGKTERLHMTLMTPSASLRTHYLTLRSGQPLRLRFKQPIAVIAYGQPGQLKRHVLNPRKPSHGRPPAARRHADRRGVAAHAGSARVRPSQLVPGRVRGERRRDPGAGHPDQPEHADHADLLEVGRRGARQLAAAGLARDARHLA